MSRIASFSGRVGWGAAFLLIMMTGFSRAPFSRAREQDPQTGWMESGDPCYQIKKTKQQIRESFGTDPSYLKCIPLRVEITWKAEESYRRHGSYGTDTARILLFHRFEAYLALQYDQHQREHLLNFTLLGPAPCCPGKVETDLLDVKANFLLCDKWGDDCRRFKTEDLRHFSVEAREGMFFGFRWDAAGIDRRGEIGSSKVRLRDGIVKRPEYVRAGILEFCSSGRLHADVSGSDSISWEDMQRAMRDGIGFFEFPVSEHEARSMGAESHSVEASAHVRLIFEEEEDERWRVTIKGREKDDTRPFIENKALSVPGKVLPIWMEFDWELVGEFTLKKIRATRLGFKSGRVVDAGALPDLKFEFLDLYACRAEICPQKGAYPPYKIIGQPLSGDLLEDSVVLHWPRADSAGCISCRPKDAALGQIPYVQQFGSREFVDIVSRETIPLQHGYKKSGTVGSSFVFTIQLEKLD